MGAKKRGAVYSVIALMLCVAVYLNWNYSRTGEDLSVGGDATETGSKILGETILVDGESDDVKPLENTAENTETGDSDYFSEARLSRQKARDEAVNILNTTVENENASEDAKAAANTDIQVMADNAMIESRIENLVVAKGYRECVVFINDTGVNVIISKLENGLSDTDAAKIKDIVIDEACVTADQIKIIETT